LQRSTRYHPPRLEFSLPLRGSAKASSVRRDASAFEAGRSARSRAGPVARDRVHAHALRDGANEE